MIRVIITICLAGVFLSLAVATIVSTARADCIVKFGGPEQSLPLLSFDEVGHADFDMLLRHYVNQRGRVCYSKWAEHRCDVNRLQAYLFHLTNVDPSRPSSREATLACYINAYNALTLWGILDNYPVVSIQNIDGKKSRYAMFDELRLWVGDRRREAGRSQ